MGVVLWMRQPVGVITPQLQRARRKKQKVSMIFTIVSIIVYNTYITTSYCSVPISDFYILDR